MNPLIRSLYLVALTMDAVELSLYLSFYFNLFLLIIVFIDFISKQI